MSQTEVRAEVVWSCSTPSLARFPAVVAPQLRFQAGERLHACRHMLSDAVPCLALYEASSHST